MIERHILPTIIYETYWDKSVFSKKNFGPCSPNQCWLCITEEPRTLFRLSPTLVYGVGCVSLLVLRIVEKIRVS